MKNSTALLLLSGTSLTAGGYGATFLFSAWFRSQGGTDIEAGTTLSMALLGTFIGVPLVGWFAGRMDASRLAALAAFILSVGYLLMGSLSEEFRFVPLLSTLLIGLGWGMFYIGAPMALSERVSDADRGHWFTRFSAFQMVGICGGPVLVTLLTGNLHTPLQQCFLLVGGAGLLAALLLAAFGRKEPGGPGDRALRPWVKKLAVLAFSPAARPIVMVGLGGCVFSGMMSFQGSLVEGTSASASTYFWVHATTAVVARLLLSRRLSGLPRLPLVSALLCCLFVGILCLLWIPIHPAFQIASAMLTGLGYGLVYPVIQTWAVNDSLPENRHAALTWFVMSYFVGIFGFPAFGGWILVAAGKVWFILALALLVLLELAAGAMRSGTRSENY